MLYVEKCLVLSCIWVRGTVLNPMYAFNSKSSKIEVTKHSGGKTYLKLNIEKLRIKGYSNIQY